MPTTNSSAAAGRQATQEALTLTKVPSIVDAFVAGEEGATTRRLLEQSETLAAVTMKCRRAWRCGALLAIIALASSGWKVLSLGSEFVDVTQAYDPAVGVEIEVRGCDVTFVPGDAPTVSYRALFRTSSAHCAEPGINHTRPLGWIWTCRSLTPATHLSLCN